MTHRLATTIIPAIGLLALALLACFGIGDRAYAQDRFFVLHANPAESDIQPGALYEEGEFVFVPDGATIVLMDREGERYVIKGLAAVPAQKDALAAHRFETPETDGRSIVEFLFDLGDDEVLAAGRNLIESDASSKRDHIALRLHVALLPQYRDGERFCLIGNELTVQRRTPLGEQTVELAGKNGPRFRQWKPGKRAVTFDRFDLDDGARGKIRLKTEEGEASVEAVRVDENVLERDNAGMATAFAQLGCTLQALLLSDKES